MKKRSASKVAPRTRNATKVAGGKPKAPRRLTDAEVERNVAVASRVIRGARCQCGKVETTEPLEMCVSCPDCDTMMHTVADERKHAACANVATLEDVIADPSIMDQAPATRRAAKSKERGATLPAAMLQWEQFFSCQRYPVLRSQLLTALMTGTVLEVVYIPTAALLDAWVLATVTRERLDAEVVDDYSELTQRVKEAWAAPGFTHAVMDQYHINLISSVLYLGCDPSDIFDRREDQEVPSMAAWLLAHNVPSYFSPKFDEEGKATRHGGKKAA